MSITILMMVVACLCFSVGEGLRLTPFPVSPRTQITDHNHGSRLDIPYETSVRKYGPLSVPTQNQKRGKRELPDHGDVPSQINRAVPEHAAHLADNVHAAQVVANTFGTRLSGRAPPPFS